MLKVGNEVYSNVIVTAVTATDIYFTHSGGIGNAKLERLDPGLQKKFHFDLKKAREWESEERKVTANFQSRVRSSRPVNSNKAPLAATDLDPRISVQTSDAAVHYKDYDPIYDRPRNLFEGGLARVDPDLSFKADFTIHPVAETNKGAVAFQIESTRISIGLTMTITQPSTPTLRLKNHLEGLKEIYEHFYALGPKAAERAGQYVGSGLWIRTGGNDRAGAEAMFLNSAQSAAQMEYAQYIRLPAASARQYYEDLTDYGRGLADSEQAAQEAIQHAEVQIPDGPIDTPPIRPGLKQ